LPGNLRDLFRVAYRIIGARTDPHAPLPPDEAVDYGLQALTTSAARPSISVAQAVARAFAEARPLDEILDDVVRVPTKVVERELKAFVADELRRLSKERGVPLEDLCDVSDRALRTWAGASETTRSASGRRKDSSGKKGA
jgi:hypothetical protein